MTTEPYRVGVLGLGNAGASLHMPALAGLPRVAIVGAADLDEARRAAAARRWGIPVFETPEELLERAQPEVVIVGTPPGTHAELSVRALDAGAHVICEKPFASTVAEANGIIAAAAARGRGVALNHEFRTMPIFQAVRDGIGNPEHLLFAQAWQLMDLPPWREPGWRGRLLQRTLFEAGVHLVDYLMALFGEKPVRVSATTSSSGARAEESDAIALVTLEFSGGRLAQIVQNRLCRGETQYFEVRADTRTASFRASFGGRARVSAGMHRSTMPHVRFEYGVSGLAWRELGHRRTLLARNPKEPAMAATRTLLERTLEAFRAGGRPPATAEDGRDAIEVIAACYESARTGSRVEVAGAEIPSGPTEALTTPTRDAVTA
jgi:predicted dehydrogenase